MTHDLAIALTIVFTLYGMYALPRDTYRLVVRVLRAFGRTLAMVGHSIGERWRAYARDRDMRRARRRESIARLNASSIANLTDALREVQEQLVVALEQTQTAALKRPNGGSRDN